MPERMTRCPEGHFYDPAKHNGCPWCALPTDTGLGGDKTRPVGGPAPAGAPPPLPAGFGSSAPAASAPHSPAAAPQPIAPTVPVAPPTPVTPPVQAAPPAQAAPKLDATRRVGTVGKMDPVVGWLVCLEGPDKGKDFRLHAEKNFIGRAPEMDVVITGDDSVSRDKHAAVIFDPRKEVFWVLPGESSGLVYFNGDVLHAPAQMKRDDVLEVGQTKLVLIPFCGEKYSWRTKPAAI